MSEPIIIDGFPVPPGCELIDTAVGKDANGVIRPCLIFMTDYLFPEEFEGARLYALQSVGFRAWMDEAWRLEYKANDMRAASEAEQYAERCRVWRAGK